MDVAGLAAEVEMDRRLLAGHFRALDRRREEDAIAPDHGRRMAAARNLRLPLDIDRRLLRRRRRPDRRQILVGRDPQAVRPAPLRPLRGDGSPGRGKNGKPQKSTDGTPRTNTDKHGLHPGWSSIT